MGGKFHKFFLWQVTIQTINILGIDKNLNIENTAIYRLSTIIHLTIFLYLAFYNLKHLVFCVKNICNTANTVSFYETLSLEFWNWSWVHLDFFFCMQASTKNLSKSNDW